jgi:hypothetical protein
MHSFQAGLALVSASIALLSVSVDADAAWRRQSASGSCVVANNIGHVSASNGIQDSSQFNSVWGNTSDPFNGFSLVCPALDDSWFPRTSVSVLNVEGYVGSTNHVIRARACASDWNSYGGWCSAYSNSGTTTGHYTMSPTLTYWGASHGGDFGYIYVSSDGDYASLAGIFYST